MTEWQWKRLDLSIYLLTKWLNFLLSCRVLLNWFHACLLNGMIIIFTTMNTILRRPTWIIAGRNLGSTRMKDPHTPWSPGSRGQWYAWPHSVMMILISVISIISYQPLFWILNVHINFGSCLQSFMVKFASLPHFPMFSFFVICPRSEHLSASVINAITMKNSTWGKGGWGGEAHFHHHSQKLASKPGQGKKS